MEQLQSTEQGKKLPVLDDNSAYSQQELLALLGKKQKSGLKKYLPLAILIVMLMLGLLFWRLFSNEKKEEDVVNYRQYTV